MEKATDRPSARELLEDPFLSVDEVDELPAISIPCQKASQGGRTKGLMPQLMSPASRIDMIIKGTMNPEDDTIFLQVQLSDKDGIDSNTREFLLSAPFLLMNLNDSNSLLTYIINKTHLPIAL